MFDVRIHGRSGAEVAATADLLAAAAAASGRTAEVLIEPDSWTGPGWTSMAVAHCRIYAGPPACSPSEPQVDGLIVQDPGVLWRAEVLDGICPETYLLVNSAQGFGDLGLSEDLQGQCRDRLMILPAAGLRVVQQDGALLSAMMAGGFAALAGIVDLASVVLAIQDRQRGQVSDGCASAARAAHDFVRTEKAAMVAA
jgi:pyruvate ferredoxin oxidoreductase gamma subunit